MLREVSTCLWPGGGEGRTYLRAQLVAAVRETLGRLLDADAMDGVTDAIWKRGDRVRVRYGEAGRVFARLGRSVDGDGHVRAVPLLPEPTTPGERRIAEAVWEEATRRAYRWARRGDLAEDPTAMANPYALDIDKEGEDE